MGLLRDPGPAGPILRFLQSYGLYNRSEIVIFGPSILHKMRGAPQKYFLPVPAFYYLSLPSHRVMKKIFAKEEYFLYYIKCM